MERRNYELGLYKLLAIPTAIRAELLTAIRARLLTMTRIGLPYTRSWGDLDNTRVSNRDWAKESLEQPLKERGFVSVFAATYTTLKSVAILCLQNGAKGRYVILRLKRKLMRNFNQIRGFEELLSDCKERLMQEAHSRRKSFRSWHYAKTGNTVSTSKSLKLGGYID